MYWINEDGKTVHRATVAPGGGINLDTGRYVNEEDCAKFLFAVDPHENRLLRKVGDGVWEYFVEGEWVTAKR